MRHVKDGDLRRLIDEPEALPAPARRHAADCARCAARLAAMREDAFMVATAFPGEAQTDARAARERLRAAEAKGLRPLRDYAPPRRLPYARIAGWTGAAAVVAALALTPIGGYAKGLLLIFQPKSFAPVPVTPSDISSLQGLAQLGDLRGARGLHLAPVSSLFAAQEAVGFHVASLGEGAPQGFGKPEYGVMGRHTASLALSASKIAAWASEQKVKLPPFPSDIATSTIFVQVGPAAVTVYGGSLSSGPFGHAVSQSVTMQGTQQSGQSGEAGTKASVPRLLIAQAPLPSVYSTGATLQQFEQYFLSIPGIPPELASEIRAIGDPKSTLPIPVPVGRLASKPVTVQGVQGLMVGDETGVGSAVVWQKDGMVYALAGSLPAAEVLQLAQTLH